MRKNIVAGNWKMNTVLEEGVELASQVNDLLKGKEAKCEVVVCVPFTHLVSVKGVIDEPLKLGAENCSEHDKGAYTGEVSASMVKSTGASHVILGHSERRQYFGENNEQLLTKTNKALSNGLTPIFCVGEVLEERENGTYNDVCVLYRSDAADDLS
ncbi:MAG: triose-phosphate isomerase, partial [Muribaculaceae bacterium]|nr:triose-phosphate isomerase [Muribaculaceae bacterium]